jgi:hypothetical protein
MAEGRHSVDPAEGAVPFQPVMSWRYSRHDVWQLTVFGSPQAWQEHWAAMHEPGNAGSCPELELAASMLIEVAAGVTPSGSHWV